MPNVTPTGMNDNGQFVIAQATDAIKSPPTIGAGSPPTLAMGTAAGTGSSAVITGTNTAGRIVLTTGISALATGVVMTLTFSGGFAFPSGCSVQFTAGDANFAAVYTKIFAVTTASSVTLSVALTALSLNTTYTGYYRIDGW